MSRDDTDRKTEGGWGGGGSRVGTVSYSVSVLMSSMSSAAIRLYTHWHSHRHAKMWPLYCSEEACLIMDFAGTCLLC